MNEHFQHKDDPKMTTEEAVQQGAAFFEKVERQIRQHKAGARKLRKVFEAIRDEGHLGGLETEALSCEADALFTAHEAAVYRIHAGLTARAKALGIDLPTIASGGR